MIDKTIDEYTWRTAGGKELKKEVRMMDLSADELKKAYRHASDMLWNRNNFNPGKYVIRKNIENIKNNCNTQLFHRYLLNECGAVFKTNHDLLQYITAKRKQDQLHVDNTVDKLFEGVPAEFTSITISKLLDACFDKLDIFNRKMITDEFIISQGIWLTKAEKADLTEYDKFNNMKNRLDVIKERLAARLNNDSKLRINTNGLSYEQLRSIVMLDVVTKISEIPTFTLKTLVDKILPLLDKDLDYHIDKWELLLKQLEEVAKVKNIELECYYTRT